MFYWLNINLIKLYVKKKPVIEVIVKVFVVADNQKISSSTVGLRLNLKFESSVQINYYFILKNIIYSIFDIIMVLMATNDNAFI